MSKEKTPKPRKRNESKDDFASTIKRRGATSTAPKRKGKARVVVDERLEMVFELGECCKAFPKYTLGQILYSALRKLSRKNDGKIGFLMDITDKELMINIDNIIKEEKE